MVDKSVLVTYLEGGGELCTHMYIYVATMRGTNVHGGLEQTLEISL